MRYTVRHGFSDFLSRKVGTKKTIRFWETATDIAAKTGRARDELRYRFCQLFGIRRDEIHRVPIIRRMTKGSKEVCFRIYGDPTFLVVLRTSCRAWHCVLASGFSRVNTVCLVSRTRGKDPFIGTS